MRLTAILAMLFLAGCESERAHGKCIGAFDDPDPALRYETSVRNVVLGAIFVETLVVPAVVIAKETKCPTGKRMP